MKIMLNYVSAADYVADNNTTWGRQKNQRVEIEMVFVPDVHSLSKLQPF